MLRKTIIALAAVCALASGIASETTTADAKIFIKIDGGWGWGGGGGDGGGGGGGDGGDGGGWGDGGDGGGWYGCRWEWQTFKKWNKSHTHYDIKSKKVWVCN